MEGARILTGVTVLCLGLSSGIRSQDPLLRDLAPLGIPSDPEADRINFAFFFVNSQDFAGSLEEARIRIERLLDFEPYRSNQGLFNFWYLDRDIQAEPSDPGEWCYRTTCASAASQYYDELDVLAGPAFALTYCFGFSCTATNSTGNGYFMPDFNSVHGEVHEIGHFTGHLIDEYGSGEGPPRTGENCAASYLEAVALWGEHVGEGCGEDGVIDCLQSRGARGEHYNEVAFFTGDPRGCFDDEGRPWPHCYFSLNINVAYLATSRDDCLSSDEDCMYLEDGNIYCRRRGEAPQECPLNEGMGCGYRSSGFRSSLCSIMAYHFPGDTAESVPWLSYGVVNQALLCERLVENMLSVREGVCATFTPTDTADCNLDGIPDRAAVAVGLSPDCNGNSIPDDCDIRTGTSRDTNLNGTPDECDPSAPVTAGPVPDPIVFDSGSCACAFTGALGPVSATPDKHLVWRRAVFSNVGRGDASTLVSGGRLFLDADGNGAVDPEDVQTGPTAVFASDSQKLVFEGLEVPLEHGMSRSWLLLLDLVAEPDPDAAGSPPAGRTRGSDPLPAVCVELLLIAVTVWLLGRRLRVVASFCVLLAVVLPVIRGCGGGGSGASGTGELRLQLEEMVVEEESSGEEAIIIGLPIRAWSFES